MSGLSRLLLAASACAVCLSSSLSAQVTVRFDPPHEVVPTGTLFDVDLVADIAQPVVGWGLDLSITNPTIAALIGISAYGPSWTPAYAPDGDWLAGLAFPNSVAGNDVLLATLTFVAGDLGQTDLLASYTLTDMTEGFPLDPTGFAQVTFQPGRITVTPEPATLLLVAPAAVMFARCRRR